MIDVVIAAARDGTGRVGGKGDGWKAADTTMLPSIRYSAAITAQMVDFIGSLLR